MAAAAVASLAARMEAQLPVPAPGGSGGGGEDPNPPVGTRTADAVAGRAPGAASDNPPLTPPRLVEFDLSEAQLEAGKDAPKDAGFVAGSRQVQTPRSYDLGTYGLGMRRATIMWKDEAPLQVTQRAAPRSLVSAESAATPLHHCLCPPGAWWKSRVYPLVQPGWRGAIGSCKEKRAVTS
jgi:hypothetical protein